MTEERRDLCKIELVRLEGSTSIHIDAGINELGDLVLSGQDTGEVPSKVFGDADYEYWLTVPRRYKDALLLALLERIYQGDAQVVSRLKELLGAKGIPCEFFSYA